MTRLCILASSPRSSGNSDTAARLVAEAATRSGLEVDLLHLREHAVRPCIACDFCRSRPGSCHLDRTEGGDDAGELFARMAEAHVLLITAPVYFYGPPAALKALIDRAQRFRAWEKAPSQGTALPAMAVLCAAREHGDKLFDASLLILRCFLHSLGRELHSPLLLRGLDGAQDLLGRPDFVRQAEALGREAALISGASAVS